MMVLVGLLCATGALAQQRLDKKQDDTTGNADNMPVLKDQGNVVAMPTRTERGNAVVMPNHSPATRSEEQLTQALRSLEGMTERFPADSSDRKKSGRIVPFPKKQ